jgi:hypothetical protein
MLYLSDFIPALRYGACVDITPSEYNASALVITTYMDDKDNSKPLAINAYPSIISAGARQGALYIGLDRIATYPLTSWDGNPDCALKIQATNRAVSGANGGTRGLEVTARNRDSGTESWIIGSYISAVNSANTIGTATAGQFITDQGGVTTNTYGVVIQDVSQGTSTNTYPLRITTGAINPASGARSAVINIASKDTAGFTNLIYAESTTLDCATVGAGTYSTAEGYFTVKVGANTYRMPFFTGVD